MKLLFQFFKIRYVWCLIYSFISVNSFAVPILPDETGYQDVSVAVEFSTQGLQPTQILISPTPEKFAHATLLQRYDFLLQRDAFVMNIVNRLNSIRLDIEEYKQNELLSERRAGVNHEAVDTRHSFTNYLAVVDENLVTLTETFNSLSPEALFDNKYALQPALEVLQKIHGELKKFTSKDNKDFYADGCTSCLQLRNKIHLVWGQIIWDYPQMSDSDELLTAYYVNVHDEVSLTHRHAITNYAREQGLALPYWPFQIPRAGEYERVEGAERVGRSMGGR